MKSRPILFSAPMVRAILGGTKTQTRRVISERLCDRIDEYIDATNYGTAKRFEDAAARFCPYGQPGDQLWVRESGWERPERTHKMMRNGADTWARFYYASDGEDGEQLREWGFKPRPSIHMPRWASRITLEIESFRAERLQDISEEDAKAEGCQRGWFLRDTPDGEETVRTDFKSGYRILWNSINGPKSWDANQWVFALNFRRIPQPTDL